VAEKVERAREAMKGKSSKKAEEYAAMNAMIPSEWRESYEILDKNGFMNKALIEEKIKEILARGYHASFRTCHNPQRPGGGDWAPITNLEELDRFLEDEDYYKYGGYSVLTNDDELTEVLIGEFPAGKLDEAKAEDHCVWTMAISDAGVVNIAIKPYTSHLRSLDDKEIDIKDLININIGPDFSSPDRFKESIEHIGENIENPEIAKKFRDIVLTTVDKWISNGLISSLAALQEVFPKYDLEGNPLSRTIALEVQFGFGWDSPKIYGIKADEVINGE
jgi:hypothetical protein